MIFNKTKNICISKDEINAISLVKQARGLMFKTKQNCLMTFKEPQPISLHNFFVFYSLDILILNNQLKIIEIKRNFKPFTFWKSTAKGKYCLELAHQSEYDTGDELVFT